MTKLVATGSDLHGAVSWASRVTPTRSVTPVLAGVLLDTEDDQVTVSGYDYETAATARIGATVDEPGRVLVSGRLLADIVKTIKASANITLAYDGATVTVREGRSEWMLPALPVEDYPQLPDLGDPIGMVEAGVFRDAVSRVSVAAGREDMLPMLTGIKLASDGPRLDLTATDRFRLATTTIPWQPAGDQPLDMLAPARLLDQAARAFRRDTDQVSIHHSRQGLGFATTTHRIIGRLLDVNYPRWRQLLPSDTTSRYVTIDTGELLAAVDKVAVAAGRTPHIRLDIHPDRIDVSTAEDDNRARTDIPVVEQVGEPTTIRISPSYLRDAVNAAGGSQVRIVLGDTPLAPVLVTPAGDDTYRHLVMPIRVPRAAAA